MKLFNRKKDLSEETYNVVQSISEAKQLYKNLVSMCHPDKHPQKIAIATELTQLINRNRYNYRELLHLKERVKNEL